MEPLTENDIKVLTEFKKNLSDLDFSKEEFKDHHLIRWLKARDMVIPKAEEMLRKNIQWREEINIEDVYNWEVPIEVLTKCPVYIMGKDKEGFPIFFVEMKTWDFKFCSDPANKEVIQKYMMKSHEQILRRFKEISDETGKIVTQSVGIYDYKAAPLKECMNMNYMNMMKETMATFEANYPEVLKQMALINIPKTFYVLYEMFKPFVPKNTIEKFLIMDSNEEKWKAQLLSKIAADVLPRKYGGMSTKPLKSFYTNAEPYEFDADDNDEEEPIILLIDAKEKLEITFNITEPNQKLRWKFRVEEFDIDFSVLENSKEIVDPKKFKAELDEFEGFVECKENHEYALVFDNSSSRLRSKMLHYNVIIGE